MRKFIFCCSVICIGLLSSCVDKNELVDEDSMPSWLGSSIYAELENPSDDSGLEGTFSTYLKIVDDLGYDETLNRTGSVTVFPANDEAFERFFESGEWEGVSSYDDLSEAQKKLLLYSSMLSNALLIEMLGNISSDDGVVEGQALKHSTALSVIDSVTTYTGSDAITAYEAENNSNWTQFTNGISVVCDATVPMLVHFTREFMLNNSITTSGDGNDFSIITGGDYEEGDAYIFDKKVIAQDVTCQNGYIHQVEDVITPPGNVAQVLRKIDNLSYFSHMVDRYAVPTYNAEVTNDYHDWYVGQAEVQDMSGVYNPDSIYEVRYLSEISQDNESFNTDVNGAEVLSDYLLNVDPGWNTFYIAPTSNSTEETYLTDLEAVFAPDDDVLAEYFVSGDGQSIIDTYGELENTKENLMSNIDDIPLNILATFVSNMLRTSFVSAVPSKFSSLVDDAKDLMGATIDDVNIADDGDYDIHIASNGVIYVTNTVYGPKAYVAVSAPALFSDKMRMINWMIQNVSYNNSYSIGLDYYAYLLTMASNYGLFLPWDTAFDAYLLDPASLGHTNTQYVYHYYYDETTKSGIGVSRRNYNYETGEISSDSTVVDIDGNSNSTNMPIVKAQLSDLMQYCTVVLSSGEELGNNNYYLTKHGGAIKITGNQSDHLVGGTVASGSQIAGITDIATITDSYSQANGRSYAIDRLIQGPVQSIYSILSGHEQFSEFLTLCNLLSDEDFLEWAGISNEKNDYGSYEVDQYKVFYAPGERDNENRCLDYNIKFFSNYNYTVFAPDNDAMQYAYSHGLPDPDEMSATYSSFIEADGRDEDNLSDEELAAMDEMYANIVACKAFIRYHFQNISVFADNEGEDETYITFLVDGSHISQEVSISGGDGKLVITDATSTTKTVDVSSGLLCNEMAREFEFDDDKSTASYVSTSSFAVLHEISSPLCYNSDGDFSPESSFVQELLDD